MLQPHQPSPRDVTPRGPVLAHRNAQCVPHARPFPPGSTWSRVLRAGRFLLRSGRPCAATNSSSDNRGIISSRSWPAAAWVGLFLGHSNHPQITAQPAGRPRAWAERGDEVPRQHVTSPPGNFHSVAPSGSGQTQSRRAAAWPQVRSGRRAWGRRAWEVLRAQGGDTPPPVEPLPVAHTPDRRPACNHRPPFSDTPAPCCQAPTPTPNH